MPNFLAGLLRRPSRASWRAAFRLVSSVAAALDQYARSKRNPRQPDRFRDDERGPRPGDS